MILLLGGTSETRVAAGALAKSGRSVLVSTATDLELPLPHHDRIRRRSGPLDEAAMARLVRDRDVGAIVDVTHPYAQQVSRTARRVADETGIAYYRFERPPTIRPAEDVLLVDGHDAAATQLGRWGVPALLTIGTRHLLPYAEQAVRRGVEVFARILPVDSAIRACTEAGINEEHQIRVRGPLSVEENRGHLRDNSVETLVTKDSGDAGGTPEKLAAARAENCRIIVLRRPKPAAEVDVCNTIDELLQRVRQ